MAEQLLDPFEILSLTVDQSRPGMSQSMRRDIPVEDLPGLPLDAHRYVLPSVGLAVVLKEEDLAGEVGVDPLDQLCRHLAFAVLRSFAMNRDLHFAVDRLHLPEEEAQSLGDPGRAVVEKLEDESRFLVRTHPDKSVYLFPVQYLLIPYRRVRAFPLLHLQVLFSHHPLGDGELRTMFQGVPQAVPSRVDVAIVG